MQSTNTIELEHQKHVFQQVMERSESISVQGYNKNHEVIYWNKASELLYGYTQKEAFGQKIENLIIPKEMRDIVHNGINEWMNNGIAIPSSELTLQDKYKQNVNVFSQHVMIKSSDGNNEMYCLDIDLKEIKEAQKQIDYFTSYDALTGLSNKISFMNRLNQALLQKENHQHALLFIDLDKFKEINDVNGHSFGDEILIQVASRIKNILRHGDTLSRLGGDEFTILLENISHSLTASNIALKVLNLFSEPFLVQDAKFYMTASIGISLTPDDSTNAESLLKYAESAMYEAKEKGRNSYSFYTKALSKQIVQKIAIIDGLRDALDNQEFSLYYQPQVDTLTNTIVGAEALIRWNHPQKGLISPITFIDIAEESGQILEIGRWVINQAMTDIVMWKEQGLIIEKVSINLSVQQLRNEYILSSITEALQKTGCKAQWIEFEITESYMMQNKETAISLLKQIEGFGFSISLDDFGTGYSSLAYLKKLPISKLKIDKSFIDDIPSVKDEDEAIVRTIILLAKEMKLDIIAEGVEHEEQREFLLKNGCSLIQGYLYYKPLSQENFTKILYIL